MGTQLGRGASVDETSLARAGWHGSLLSQTEKAPHWSQPRNVMLAGAMKSRRFFEEWRRRVLLFALTRVRGWLVVRGLFLYYPLLLEYQVRGVITPNFFE